jgi:hypothetical protein
MSSEFRELFTLRGSLCRVGDPAYLEDRALRGA